MGCSACTHSLTLCELDAFDAETSVRALKGCNVLSFVALSLLQISANLADRESRHLAAADTVKKAEEKLQPVKVGLVTD